MKIISSTVVLFLAINTEQVIATEYPTPQYPGQFVVDYPVDGIILGQGFDTTRNSKTTGICVEVDEAQLENNSFTTSAKQMLNKRSLYRSSAFSIAASYSAGGFGASGSVEAKKSYKFNSDRFHFLLSFEADHSSVFAIPKNSSPYGPDSFASESGETLKYIDSSLQSRRFDYLTDIANYRKGQFTLTEDALKILKPNAADSTPTDLHNFQKICGSGFVSAIHRGSSVDMVISSATQSVEQNRSLKASLKASGFGASVSGKFSKTEITTSEDINIQTDVFQRGGLPFQPPGKISDLSKFYESTDIILSEPVAYKITVTPYSSFIDQSINFSSIRDHINFLSEYYLAVRSLYDTTTDIYEQVVTSSIDSSDLDYSPELTRLIGKEKNSAKDYITLLHDDIYAHLNFVHKMIDTCVKSPSSCNREDVLLDSVEQQYDFTKHQLLLKNQLDVITMELVQQSLNVFSSELSSKTDHEILKDKLKTNFYDNQNLYSIFFETDPDDEIVGNSSNYFENKYTNLLDSDLNKEVDIFATALTAADKNKYTDNIKKLDGPNGIEQLWKEFDEIRLQAKKAIDIDDSEIDDNLIQLRLIYENFLADTDHRISQSAYYARESSRTKLSQEFYLQYYRLLARLPLPKATYPLLATSKVAKTTTNTTQYSRSTVTQTTVTITGQATPVQSYILENPTQAYQHIVLKERLIPHWKEYCSANIAHLLCVSIENLEDYAVFDVDEDSIKAAINKSLASLNSVSTSTSKEYWPDPCDRHWYSCPK